MVSNSLVEDLKAGVLFVLNESHKFIESIQQNTHLTNIENINVSIKL